MAISTINPASSHKISFGRSIVADIAKKQFDLDDKTADKVDHYGKISGAGGMGGLITSFFAKDAIGGFKAFCIGFIGATAVLYASSLIFQKVKELIKNDSNASKVEEKPKEGATSLKNS